VEFLSLLLLAVIFLFDVLIALHNYQKSKNSEKERSPGDEVALRVDCFLIFLASVEFMTEFICGLCKK